MNSQKPLGITIKQSNVNGTGVFATRRFEPGETVVAWHATREISREEYEALPSSERRYIEVEDQKILLVGIPERFVNHSCDANTTHFDRRDVATRVILPNEEITADYRTAYLPDGPFVCHCGSENCVGVVKGRIKEDS